MVIYLEPLGYSCIRSLKEYCNSGSNHSGVSVMWIVAGILTQGGPETGDIGVSEELKTYEWLSKLWSFLGSLI